MAATSRTATSTPRLSEYARLFLFPAGITKTVWTRVEAKGRDLGLGFDWWQTQLGTVCLGYGADGKYVATIGGIGLSIPRQVGKTYFVMALLFIMCILFPGYQAVWTSHHMRTTTRTLRAMNGLAKRRKIAPHIRAVRVANGEGQVDFVNGSSIMLGARSQGFGRGFDEIDAEVFDEAQILDTKALEDMVAATNQARHVHGALLFFMGTPPRPTDVSEAFTARREEALAAKKAGAPLEDAVWLEIGAEPGSDANDHGQFPGMNPSYPTRTPLESLLRLRKNLKDDDSWNREGRGLWDDDAEVPGDLDSEAWAALGDPSAERGKQVSFGLYVAEDRSAWIAVAWKRLDGKVQVQLVERDPVPAYRLVERCKALASDWNAKVVPPPKDFEEELAAAGVRIEPMPPGSFPSACGAFEDAAFKSRDLRHGNQAALNRAVRLARWKVGSSGEKSWEMKNHPEVGPLVAATRALYGLARLVDTPFNIW